MLHDPFRPCTTSQTMDTFQSRKCRLTAFSILLGIGYAWEIIGLLVQGKIAAPTSCVQIGILFPLEIYALFLSPCRLGDRYQRGNIIILRRKPGLTATITWK